MKFSIIIPVFNLQDKIFKCLTSIENQSYTNYEALIILDGSTDNSINICKKFAQRDSRFKVIYKSNGGLVSARKQGAKASTGEYIVNIDGDDYIDDNYLMEANDIIRKFSPDMIAFGFKKISNKVQHYKNSISEGYYNEKDLIQIRESIIYDKNGKGFHGGSLINSIWTKIVRRSIYQKYQSIIPDHISVGEDLILNAYLLLDIKSIYVSNRAYYNYIIYSSSMMHKYDINNFRYYINVSAELNKIEYINKNDIKIYLSQAFISEIRKLAKNSDSYYAFKATVKKNKDIDSLHKYAKEAKVRKTNFEFMVKYLLINSSYWPIVYIICKFFT